MPDYGSNLYSVVVSVISALGGIAVAFISVAWKKRADRRKTPKDRMEVILDGYDGLIAQLKEDQERKDGIIDQLQRSIEAQATIINDLRGELAKSSNQIANLEKQLATLKIAL